MADQILRIFERVCIAIAVLCLLFAIFRVWVMEDVRGPFARKEYYQLGDTKEGGYLRTEFAEKIKSDLSHQELISDLEALMKSNEEMKIDLEKRIKAAITPAELARAQSDLDSINASQIELQAIIGELKLDAATSTISATPEILVPSPIPPAPASATEPATLPMDVTPMSVAPPPFPATSEN